MNLMEFVGRYQHNAVYAGLIVGFLTGNLSDPMFDWVAPDLGSFGGGLAIGFLVLTVWYATETLIDRLWPLPTKEPLED